jgi:glycerophosphoryl diester phosphodiesterase
VTRRAPAQVSAHRCLTSAQLEHALSLDVEFVEFDVQRCTDGLVVFHDTVAVDGGNRVRVCDLTVAELREVVPDVLEYAEMLTLLAAGGKGAHVDLKFPDGAVEAAALAVACLGAEDLVVTTLFDRSVRAIRDWADEEGHDLLVGLSLGRGVTGISLWRQAKVRASEVWPQLRYRQSRANVVVAHHWLARFGVARFARRAGLPLLVWTVDTEDSLRYWLRGGRAWLVTTNRPEVALRIRSAGKLRT